VQPPHRDPGTESHYEYGSRAGVWRLARIFDAAGVPVTVSAAAVALELNPGVAGWMRERGHDLMGHGWRWIEPWTMPREHEREQIARAVETYEQVFGSPPPGWSSRSWPSENTRELLLEQGGFYRNLSYRADTQGEAIADAVIRMLQSGDKPGTKRIAYYTAPAWVNSKDDRAYCFTVPKDAK